MILKLLYLSLFFLVPRSIRLKMTRASESTAEKTAARPASEDPDAKEASAFDALFGSEGQVMEYGMISESDTAGARYIFLGYRTFSRGIAAILRVSKDKVVCWEMDRTGENTEKARQFLDSAVPMCYIAPIENKQIKRSAVYIREKAENNPYERFLEDACQFGLPVVIVHL